MIAATYAARAAPDNEWIEDDVWHRQIELEGTKGSVAVAHLPARNGVALPKEFTEYSAVPDHVLSIPPDQIAANRTAWQDEWTQIVLR